MIFNRDIDDYEIIFFGTDSVRVIDLVGNGGNDVMTRVERIVFNDDVILV